MQVLFQLVTLQYFSLLYIRHRYSGPIFSVQQQDTSNAFCLLRYRSSALPILKQFGQVRRCCMAPQSYSVSSDVRPHFIWLIFTAVIPSLIRCSVIYIVHLCQRQRISFASSGSQQLDLLHSHPTIVFGTFFLTGFHFYLLCVIYFGLLPPVVFFSVFFRGGI